MLYVVLGHRIANTTVANTTTANTTVANTTTANTTAANTTAANTTVAGAPGARRIAGIDQLGAAMLVGAVAATPAGFSAALPVFTHPAWLAWGIGVGLCSSVIPYVMDQLAMARLPRASFALMLALLPAFATITGAVVLGQIPTARELAGIGLVIVGVAVHRADAGPPKVKGRGGVPGSCTPPSRAAPGARRSAGGTAGPR
jgi:threonine/homoserine efflux transporter RhtA